MSHPTALGASSTTPPGTSASRTRRLWTFLRAPWTARTWRDTAHVLVGGLLGATTAAVTLALLVVGTALAVTVVVPLAALAALVGCVRLFTAVQRSRFAVFLGVDPGARRVVRGRPGEPPRARLTTAWLNTWSAQTWRQVAYHLLAGVIGVAGFAAVASTWCVALILCTVPLHGWGLPSSGPFGLSLRSPAVLAVIVAAGAAVLLTAPWVARVTAAFDLAVARGLLGPSRREERAELNRRLTGLVRSRDVMVEVADAERRRIERDLHDGAQQRLVTLAMNLGVACATLTDLPEPARKALAEAHDEAKQALAELRDFVRGLHPAVLDDRGLDAALSGLAARSPVPVRLTVDLPRRPPPPIEAVAYFVASEALTNVAKHAHASRVEVTLKQADRGWRGEWLTLVIADDGDGGARDDTGTGLPGLARRVASVDGSLHIASPPGGPTSITVELPCAL